MYFVISNTENLPQICRAETYEQACEKVLGIREKFERYYREFIVPGYWIILADNIRVAKQVAKKTKPTCDLPLFINRQEETNVD